MTKTSVCICENIINLNSVILLEYRTGRLRHTMGIPIGDEDFEIAKNLQPGDKFILETRDVVLHSTNNIYVPDNTITKIGYIIEKIQNNKNSK